MSEQFTPTTEEVLGMLGSYLYEYGAGCDMNLPGNSPDEIVDRWLARRDAEVAAKALEDAASAWQINGWSNDLPEKGAERAQVILHMAQAATEMLRLRAAEYRKAVEK